MATLGQQGDSIAQLQLWLNKFAAANPSRFGQPITVTGTFDTATQQALRLWQAANGLPQTGDWDITTLNKAKQVTLYLTKGTTADPYATVPQANSIGEDRQWLYDQYNALYGRAPTQAEMDKNVSLLQSGWSRAGLTSLMERLDAGAAVTKIYQDLFGREPTATERTTWEAQLKAGRTTRLGMRDYLSKTPEALSRPPVTAPIEGAEDSQAYLNGILDEIGLGSLKDWAWEQIQQGHSPARIEMDMRQTDEWKVRFSGNVARVNAGLPPLPEDQYLAYEEQAEQIMRANGMPVGFRTQEQYAELIAGNVSPLELRERIEEGFVRVNSAPQAVRDQFAEWFGASGDSALAAFMLDKDKAIPLLREQIATAEIGGIGDTFDLDFTYARATTIAQAGIDADQARQGFGQLQQMDPLFSETVSEVADLTAEDQGADAVFNLGGEGATILDRRARERSAATSGGGGAAVGSGGVGAGTSD